MKPANKPGGAIRIRIVIADDHRVLRYSLANVLGQYADLDVVAEAVDGEQAVEVVRQHRPHVVVMDVGMPRLNGIEATRRIAAAFPGVRIVGLSMHEDDEVANFMLEAGATAFVGKDAPVEDLVAAIRG